MRRNNELWKIERGSWALLNHIDDIIASFIRFIDTISFFFRIDRSSLWHAHYCHLRKKKIFRGKRWQIDTDSMTNWEKIESTGGWSIRKQFSNWILLAKIPVTCENRLHYYDTSFMTLPGKRLTLSERWRFRRTWNEMPSYRKWFNHIILVDTCKVQTDVWVFRLFVCVRVGEWERFADIN